MYSFSSKGDNYFLYLFRRDVQVTHIFVRETVEWTHLILSPLEVQLRLKLMKERQLGSHVIDLGGIVGLLLTEKTQIVPEQYSGLSQSGCASHVGLTIKSTHFMRVQSISLRLPKYYPLLTTTSTSVPTSYSSHTHAHSFYFLAHVSCYPHQENSARISQQEVVLTDTVTYQLFFFFFEKNVTN